MPKKPSESLSTLNADGWDPTTEIYGRDVYSDPDAVQARLDARPSKPSDVQVGGNHYKSFAIQPGEFIYRNGLGWHEGNAIKYICRHKAKNGRQDIQKAIHYLQLLLELEYDK